MEKSRKNNQNQPVKPRYSVKSPTRGGARANSGRVKGSKNIKTQQWEQLGEFLTQAGAERVANFFETCSDEEFMRYYTLFLEYFKPKLQRTSFENDKGDTVAPVYIKIQ